MDRIDLTWPDGDGHPMRIVDIEPVTYVKDQSVVENGERVVKRTRTEFTLVSARPATEAEVRKWRKQ